MYVFVCVCVYLSVCLRQAQSEPKHRRKSSVLRRRLKTVNDVHEVTSRWTAGCSIRAKPRPEMRGRQ